MTARRARPPTPATDSDRDVRGYRVLPGSGPAIRSDVVDVYIVRRAAKPSGWSFLQLRRAKSPLLGTWQPIMGHIERGETAITAAIREAHEEAGLDVRSPVVRGVWALEQVHPYYLAAIDCIVLSPRFVVEVAPRWEPTLNREHDDHRWVARRDVTRKFMWPGQWAAVNEALTHVLKPGAPARESLRVPLPTR